MIKTDSHIHTAFSSDSEAQMEDMVKQGIKLGLLEMCITDHMDYGFPKKYDLDFVFDPKPYLCEIERLKKKYDGKIDLRTGVELGLTQTEENKIRALPKDYRFDYVIGSIHVINNTDPYEREYWESFQNEEAAIRTYFETTLNCLHQYDDFDSMGHLDYVIRYAPSGRKNYSYKKYADIIDEILLHLIETDKALEINTSDMRNSSIPNPDMDIMKRFLDLGGNNITIGSDGHMPERIALGFDLLEKKLKENGLRRYVTYHDRKPVYHTIS